MVTPPTQPITRPWCARSPRPGHPDFSPTSTQYINPMDINANYSEEDNPIALKADFILSLCELVVGGKEGLQPVEKTVIDRCVHQIYHRIFPGPPA